jgi:hypothetical protein
LLTDPHLNVSPFDDDFCLFPEEEGVEAHVINAEVEPALSGDVIFPVIAGVVCQGNGSS